MSSLSHFLMHLMAQYGVAALFVSVTLEALGLPLPGESAIIAASAAAAAGDFSIVSVAVAAFFGAVLGDNIGYLIGRNVGRSAIARYGARLGVTDERLRRVEGVVARYGPAMVLVARFVVLLRQLNGIVAGTTGMRWPVFVAANAAGAALWVGLWTTLVYRLGHVHDFLPALWRHMHLIASVATVVLIVALIGIYLLRHRARSGGPPD